MIFVDSSFWIAVMKPADRHHGAARRLFDLYGSRPLLTTNHVAGETWTFLRRRVGHRGAVRFLEILGDSASVEVTHVSEALEARALRWLRQHDEREYSFTDATSFALMRARKIRDALAFDRDFSAAGFVELRP